MREVRKQPISKVQMFSNSWLNWRWKKRKPKESEIEELTYQER